MKIYYSDSRQNQSNTKYPHCIEVNCVEDLSYAVQFDHVCAEYKDGYRKKENFIHADCAMFDVDNTHSEDPTQWISPNALRKAFPDVAFYIVYSRNHMKEKNGHAPRPKFHVYYHDKDFCDLEEYTKHKEHVCNYFTAFDQNAKDAARFFFGVDTPKVEYYEGMITLSDFMTAKNHSAYSQCESRESTDNEEKQSSKWKTLIIPEGQRNSTLISYACVVLKRFGDTTDTAYRLFIKRSLCCSPLLEQKEIQDIWKSAVKFYNNKIKLMSNYISPSEYSNTEPTDEFGIKDQTIFFELLSMPSNSKHLDLEITKKFLKAFGISIQMNEMSHQIEIKGLPSKYHGEDELKTLSTLIQDRARSISFKSLSAIQDYFEVIAQDHRYHPVLELLLNEEWDGVERLPEIFSILGLNDDLDRILFKKWALQTIALLYNTDENPISAQGILVLQGMQGTGKTEFFRHLAINRSFFKEGSVIDMKNKDTIISTTSVWICELGELDYTTQKKQSALKAFLSSEADIYRVPYGRKDIRRIRKTSFC